ncbi:PREDICTED: protein polyglycylase TTLL10-like [Chrysochloris asiatica]|uniref:Tubulin--tyrosine ligase-like protein 10 n=1 Tax=Chrysochloris asiatica TaxID=185453 RepID=A0A9B0U1L9_CHRAS|nr:PREDICTED: protein polyglycylase TTLL10-like [Chrysochloris asiatica]
MTAGPCTQRRGRPTTSLLLGPHASHPVLPTQALRRGFVAGTGPGEMGLGLRGPGPQRPGYAAGWALGALDLDGDRAVDHLGREVARSKSLISATPRSHGSQLTSLPIGYTPLNVQKVYTSTRPRRLRRRRGGAERHPKDSPAKAGHTQGQQDVDTALPPRRTRPHRSHGDRSQSQAKDPALDPEQCPPPGTAVQGQGPRPQAALRHRRKAGTTTTHRSPHPSASMPAARGRTQFTHRRGPPTRDQVATKRSKRLKVAVVRRGRPQAPGEHKPDWAGIHHRQGRPLAPGWAHERSMGTGQEEGRLHQLGQLDHNAELLEDTDTTRSLANPLEEKQLEGEKQPPSTGQGPFFYIGGTNGASIISAYCKSKGWQRIQDSRREDYKLKWCEVKCRDTYCNFREGEQLLYQLPNNKLLTTKIGLLSALREYSRVVNKINKTSQSSQAKILRMEEFFPETYRLDIREEREAFFALFDETKTWICKPTASNQGKGIFLLRNRDDVAALQAKTQSIEDDPVYRKMPFRAPQARIVQRYIQNPLLLDGKKFDVRSYLLIACATPYMVFFGHGYARLTLGLYDPNSSDLSGHLTNQFMQKKSPLYVLLKEDTVWSMDHLNRYINDKFRKTKGLPKDWVFTTFTKRMQQIMAHCFLAVKSKLECKLGFFDLIGCDFLIDENFKVWLLEMNSNPALHTNCEVLKEVIPGVVMETLDLALETFQKSLRGQKMLPLLSQRRFVLLHNGETDLWPRLSGSRLACRPPPVPSGPRPSCETGPSAPQSQTPAPDRPGARRPGPPRGAGSGRPSTAQRRSRQPQEAENLAPGLTRPPLDLWDAEAPGAGLQLATGEALAPEPYPGPAEDDHEEAKERKAAGHRGS